MYFNIPDAEYTEGDGSEPEAIDEDTKEECTGACCHCFLKGNINLYDTSHMHNNIIF
jgi:hypothetical protein